MNKNEGTSFVKLFATRSAVGRLLINPSLFGDLVSMSNGWASGWGAECRNININLGSYTGFNLVKLQCRMKFSAVDVMEWRNLEEELACKSTFILSPTVKRKYIFSLSFELSAI